MSAEWAWTLASAVAAVVAAWGLSDSWADLRALGARANGRRVIAVGYIRSEFIRLAISLAWVAIGVAVIVRPGTVEWSPSTAVLVATNAAIALNSILAARDRLAVRRAVQRSLPYD